MSIYKPRSLAQDTETIKKEIAVLDGRSRGLTYQQIADENGWAGGRATAKRAWDRAIARLHTGPATESRDRQLMQLSEALTTWYPKMLAGDPQAALVCDRIWKRQAAIEGFDAPTQVRHIVTDAVMHDIENLARELGVNVEATPIRPPTARTLDRLAIAGPATAPQAD